MCFDESLISAQSLITHSRGLLRSCDLLEGAVKRSEIRLSAEFLRTLHHRISSFLHELNGLKHQVKEFQQKHRDMTNQEGPAPKVPDELRYSNIRLDAVDIDVFASDIQVLLSCDWSKPLLAFFNLCGQMMRLVVTEHGEESMLSYTVTVPSEIERMVILDASNPIRLLTQMDKDQIVKAETLPLVQAAGITNLTTLFDYSNVTIYRYNAGGGRQSFQNDKNNSRIKDAVGLLKTIPGEDSVLFFVFKGDDHNTAQPDFNTLASQATLSKLYFRPKRKKDIRQLLEQELVLKGYDLTNGYICIETLEERHHPTTTGTVSMWSSWVLLGRTSRI